MVSAEAHITGIWVSKKNKDYCTLRMLLWVFGGCQALRCKKSENIHSKRPARAGAAGKQDMKIKRNLKSCTYSRKMKKR